MSSTSDATALVAGVAAWAAVIPLVKLAGPVVANGSTGTKVALFAALVGFSATTTPIMSRVLGWRTSNEKVRGIALALGAAQVADGLAHFFYPTIYSPDARVAVGAAGAIFAAAGALGIFSAHA